MQFLRGEVVPCSKAVGGWARFGAVASGLLLIVSLSGCSHFQRKAPDQYVYLTARQASLRDRVAAVSNRTGMAQNGDRLVVLEHARRWVKVRTPRGEVGWIEEKLTANQDTADRFDQLRQQNEHDPVVATASARDEVYLHVAPGRETEHFFLLAEGDPLSLIRRATVAKAATPGAAAPKLQPKPLPVSTKGAVAAAPAPDAPLPPVMEDWWLVRDKKGDTGWIYSHMIDVTEPDALSRYAEGQRIVGAYLLANAEDPESNMVNNGQTVTSIPQYVTVLSPPKAGLPYDFNQVRVFTWNTKKHRYETAFREKNIAGYLPVELGPKKDPYSKAANAAIPLPGFTYRVLAADAPIPTPDPVTGEIKPARTVAKTYRLEGNLCRRIVQPGVPSPAEAHPDAETEKKAEAKRGHKR
jgi:SH3-like domain-containing protein